MRLTGQHEEAEAQIIVRETIPAAEQQDRQCPQDQKYLHAGLPFQRCGGQ
ncbi:unnamed protein product [Ciceribacter selenitireducens ATCC BAA-1503]|uniref:Uncharacterized protein n=1 Tax=Ciceribacter selenitireducens ATCC BAA-1503 TaxID=1336235 RepID=A0A376ALU5_9HYPH|nr:unnamed protein product [Ciceribacter selenitireducens ATCC BAA-1503]